MGFSTKAIHAGNHPDPSTGAVTVPIYQTSTYAQEEIGKHKGYEYSRTQNPTRSALEENLAALEGGTHGFAFSSGMGATTTLIMAFLKSGDHVVASNNMYGGTFRVFDRVFTDFGLSFTYVDTANLAEVEAAITARTKLLFIETPTNPMMTISDLPALATLAKKHGVLTCVDNTFATPYLQLPLACGIDVVMHSTTKYLNGHSDMVGGALVVNDAARAERLAFMRNAIGTNAGPMDSWLVLRGTKTLAVRMEKHCANAMLIAEWASKHPKIAKVYYPGLTTHPQHALAARQMRLFGGMVSIETGSLDNAKAFAKAVRVFTLAESLGGVESLVCHPVSMTHAFVPQAERERTGLTDGLIRLSVGIEEPEDLIADLDQALATLG